MIQIFKKNKKEEAEEIKKSENKYKDLVEMASDWIWEVDAQGIYTYANPRVKDLLGYKPEEVVGKTPFDLMPKEEAEKIGKIFGEIAKNKKPFSGLENWNVHKNGRKVLLETSGVPILDKAGNLLGYRGIDRDITELKKAREFKAVERERKYIESIIAVMPASLIVVEPDAKIKSVNPTTCELLGYTEKQLVGQPIENIFGAAAAAAAAAAESIFKGAGLEKLVEQGTIRDERMMYLTKNGEEIPVSVSGSVTRDEKGKLQYIVVVAKDLREIKKYAAQRLAKITPVLQKISMGDFSKDIEIPEKEDEFTEHLVALSLMIDDLRETVGKNAELVKDLEKEKMSLEKKVKERTISIDAANQQLKAGNQQLEAVNQQLAASQKQLQDKLLELERFNKVAVGRELRMVELKEEIARLKDGMKKSAGGMKEAKS